MFIRCLINNQVTKPQLHRSKYAEIRVNSSRRLQRGKPHSQDAAISAALLTKPAANSLAHPQQGLTWKQPQYKVDNRMYETVKHATNERIQKQMEQRNQWKLRREQEKLRQETIMKEMLAIKNVQ